MWVEVSIDALIAIDLLDLLRSTKFAAINNQLHDGTWEGRIDLWLVELLADRHKLHIPEMGVVYRPWEGH